MATPHSSALRKGRFSGQGLAYLLTASCAGRQPFFSDWRAGRLVALELRRAEAEGLARSFAWVVMPDHFHWLCVLGQADLGSLMRIVKSRSARAANAFLGRTGPIWQGGFHDRALRREDDLRQLARYTILNPVRAGLVERVGNYPLWDASWF